ncbi:3-oxoacyl-[acyl-carrier-protein] synthase II [Paenibacillus algorifonticola]|uniref:3-oxoacyl-[acyl-carrier-protein] synthase 2 n=1 Tax=Paenibacillus algorifonticola TaxID=684063 RepID=A0A1I2BEJ6_9BACL|nr:beta-ketoacyl-ACP synthase II [Paenibacillus algorifonticola]SFE54622.1 3-oxoacyl-[acyl-carrier-protein] synthase II [Paenibacillus algorifonticola]
MNRVVVTGLGVVSPLGIGVETFWEGMLAGKSGIGPIDTFDATKHKTHFAGLVRDFNPEEQFGKKEARKMDRFTQFGLAAAEEALADSGLQLEQLDRERLAVYVGSGIGGLQTLQDNEGQLRQRGPGRVSPLLVPMMIANMAAAQISIRLGSLGPTLAPVTACSVGNTAIGEAFRLIRGGWADVVFAGGSEAAVTDIALAGFGNATAISTRNEEPQRASRPFDSGRDGFVMSEGAGIMVLESLEHAQSRGARIYAEVVGYGATSDAYHIVATPPDGDGAYRAMKLALQEAGLAPADVDVISAHATSTEVGDSSEASAIRRLFAADGQQTPAVTATKSMLGHMLGASGGAQAIALAKGLQEGVITPTINYEQPDPACGDLDIVAGEARRANIKVGLTNSFGFGGHNAVIAMRKFEE